MSEDGQIFAITTNYMCNEFLADSDFDMFERMKRDNPRRYAVAGLGEWGTDGDSVFENWDVKEFNWKEVLHRHKTNVAVFGLDFGLNFKVTSTEMLSIKLGEPVNTGCAA